ncbi:MAG: DUF3352 domain-containing protein [Candidatus Poribacteria bacterium]|nr:DUF3352 domain-containing protein [Candidatus Poribacteria bacterium]
MKKCLSLPLIALALLTMCICVGCGAKEVPPTTTSAAAESAPVQESQEMGELPQSAEETSEHEAEEETSEHESEEEHEAAEEASEHEAEEEHESAEETSEHEAAKEASEHESAEETSEHEAVEETSEHETEEEHESAEETSEHEAEEETSEHETEAETPHETEPEMVEIPSGSVLHLIPKQTMGLIYCPSLLELDYRINTLVTDLIPTDDDPEILAKILADSFGAGFESLAELEEIGLDLNQDFAVFMTSLNPPGLSALVHLTDPAAMKQVIDAESAGSAPIEYNGVTYWNASGGGGSFALLDNILVFSRFPEVCESVIDTYKATQPSVTANPNYTSFLTDIVEGDAQVAAHFNFESIAPLLTASIQEESESMRDGLESDAAAMAFAPFVTSILDSVANVIEQLESLSATLEVKGTDVQLAPSVKFKDNSEIQQSLEEMIPDDLAVLNDLPNLAFVNGAFQGSQQLMAEMNTLSLKLFSGNLSEEQQDKFDALLQQMTTFYESLGEELGFASNFSDSFLPDYLIIYEIKEKQKAETYMSDMFLEQFRYIMQVMREMVGDLPQLGMYDGAHAGPTLMHNDVEIKSYIFPNFGSIFAELPPEAATLMPEEWNWYYAFHEDQLFFATGSAELIQAALDRKSGIGDSLSENASYQKLTTTLGTDNNLLLALSPMTLVKSLMPIVGKADPNAGAAMQMFAGMFMNVPETYSIGFSAKVQEGGIGAKLLLTLGDFKQAVQMILMMQNMGQMQ